MSVFLLECNYHLSETTANDIELYERCFTQESFRAAYDVSILQSELSLKISEIALRTYKDVKRFVLYYKSEPISFCHFLVSGNTATVSGGLTPELFNTGKGVFAAVIFYDFYFNVLVGKILFAEIQKDNLRSLRMHKALGFIEISSNDKIKLKLVVNQFPNAFTKRLLSRLNYELK